jgi:Flp pilus assembly protein TadB
MIVLFLAVLAVGCARTESRDTSSEQKRNLRRETVETRQEIAPSGQVVQLTTKTVTTEREQTAAQEQESGRTEIEAPKVLDTLKPLATAAATAVMGPAGGAAVNYLWETVAGVGLAGATGGAGMVIRERRRREEDRELRKKMVKAQDDYAADIENAETDAEVARIKAKHAERQKALGIHEQLTRERHGA